MSIDLILALLQMSGHQKELAAQARLFSQDDPVRSLFVILRGAVNLERSSAQGAGLTLQRARPVTVVSEASLYSGTYHCSAVCIEPSAVWGIAKADVLKRIGQDVDFADALISHLAHEIQRTRQQAEIVSLKTISARLDAWLEWRGGRMPPKGEWKTLASQISVSPEALYREIAKRK
jgi:CRP-like cAMP-binding protein